MSAGPRRRRGRGPATAALASLVLALGCARAGPEPPPGAALTHGPVVGIAGPGRAVVWARTSRPATLRVIATPEGGGPRVDAWLETRARDDHAGQVGLEGLAPDRVHRVRVLGADPPGEARFRSAPTPDADAGWRLAFGGDLAGQNVCRDAERGVPAFDAMRARDPDLFVGLGDMIYADSTCAPRGALGNRQVPGGFGPSRTLEDFFA
ncbi:MAG: hypothetical protein R3263_06065, partial [Myxococcota bacterium]|nr:hypothetical protein [Myxococcota bacterium]